MWKKLTIVNVTSTILLLYFLVDTFILKDVNSKGFGRYQGLLVVHLWLFINAIDWSLRKWIKGRLALNLAGAVFFILFLYLVNIFI